MTLRMWLVGASVFVSGSLWASTKYLDEAVLYGSRADCAKAERELAVRISKETPLELTGLCLKDEVEKGKFLLFWRSKDDRPFATAKTLLGHVRTSEFTYTERQVEDRDGKFRIRAVEKRGSRNHDVPYETEEDCTKSATGTLSQAPEIAYRQTLRCGEGVEQMTFPLVADCHPRGKLGWDLRTIWLNYCPK